MVISQLKLLKLFDIDGKVYALDVYAESIEKVKAEVQNQKLSNVNPILADTLNQYPLMIILSIWFYGKCSPWFC